MITYTNFKKKWLGKAIDYDKAYLAQCVDVYRQYCHELGFKQSPSVRGAVNIWDTYLKENFTRITNTPTGVPQQGDVIIWGTKISSYGHIAIFDSGDVNNFYSLDQNWPTDGGKGVLHRQKHTYNGVLGWLRPKPMTNETDLQACLKAHQSLMKQLEEKNKENVRLQKLLAGNEVIRKDLSRQYNDVLPKLNSLEEEKRVLADKIATDKKEITNISEQLDEAETKRKQYKRLYESALSGDISKKSTIELVTYLLKSIIKRNDKT